MAEQMSEEQIVSAFEKSVPMNSSQPQEPEAKQPVEASQPDQQSEAPSEETAKVEAAATEDQETQTIEIDPDEPLFEQEITDNGKKETKKLSLKELQRGYIAQAETTRRFQEAARIRTEAQEAVQKVEQQAIEQTSKRLEQLQHLVLSAAAPELANVNWDKLAAEDAFEYVRLQNRANQIKNALATIQAEQDKLRAAQNETRAKTHAEKLAKTDELLRGEIPEYGDQIISRFIKAAVDAGYTKEELADQIDHRLFRLAHKAALYDDLQTKQSTDATLVAKKVSVVPKTLKPGAKPAATTKFDEARKNLKRTGKGEDALPFFEAMIR